MASVVAAVVVVIVVGSYRGESPASRTIGSVASVRSNDHTLLSAHDPDTGRYDAKRLAETMALSQKGMAAIVGYTPRGPGKNPTSTHLHPASTQTRAACEAPLNPS